MKKQFAAMAAKFGGTCHYAGNTERPVFKETSTMRGGVPGKPGVLITTRVLDKFISTERVMFVKGMNEAQATAFNKAWGNTPVPFQVVFQ